ncbi:dihydroxy-acid dehydratase [Herbiconiux sp. KACC 21604]|uniref:dihydroxy-acid dehydratase n=1 Tax=unclassified Herbiconiux TaxID=2618217 RepID=UPI0014920252|nr:dihydroxy-acid dehydratase [Herbiconiux sp. SALV-R1]QJU55286.1 dihydroxy-acid dehydratase [Herbiconiux sp. SALV-R1]WPO86453.1 dihydroxy-acid dehydratase [Herbiconiux sp. KACC 21604]
MRPLRSSAWFSRDDEVGLEHRAAMRSAGHPVEAGAARPVIGLMSSINGFNPCNLPLRRLVDAARAGVEAAGGTAVELPVMSLGEDLMKPTAMLYRNLLAMEVEEYIRSQPVDGVVLFGNCDKTVPAQLMAAASADVPAIQVTGGFRSPGRFRGAEVGAGTDLWAYWSERRAGQLDDEGWNGLEVALSCSQGACNVMGTAMTMGILAETLGMMLPGSSVLPSDDPRLAELATLAGRRIVDLVAQQQRPRDILTEAAFDNALLVLAACGGSTNALVHLSAIAGRRGIRLSPDRLAVASAQTPVLVDVAPIGSSHIAAFSAAGGVPALLRELAPLLRRDVVSVGEAALGATVDSAASQVIRSLHDPVTDVPAFAVVHGNIAPDGALIKTAAASPALLNHVGTAIVFDGYEDMLARIDDPELGATAGSVLILRNCGPRAGDGFPEWGMIPVPKHLAEAGVTDMVRLSDARMSGTSFGTCVLHIAPDAASGGPLALLRTGDVIELDAAGGRIHARVDAVQFDRRRALWTKPTSRHRRGWPRLFDEHVLQAPEGCDFDFLVPEDDAALEWQEPTVGRS